MKQSKFKEEQKKEEPQITEKNLEVLTMVTEHIKSNVLNNGVSISKALTDANKFLKKTTTYMEEEGLANIFDDLIKTVKKKQR